MGCFYSNILAWIKEAAEEIPARERLGWLNLVYEALGELAEELEKDEVAAVLAEQMMRGGPPRG